MLLTYRQNKGGNNMPQERKESEVKYNSSSRWKNLDTGEITEIAKKSKVSRQIVSDTLKILEESQIIARKTGAIMIHSNLVHRGNHSKEKYLLARFQEWGKDDEGLDI